MYGYSSSQLSTSGAEAPAVTIAGLNSPNGVAFDANGDLWVSSFNAGTVSEFTPSELTASGSPAPAVVLSGSGLHGPARLSFDSAGDLWVDDYGNSTVVEYTPAQLGTTASPAPAVTLSSHGSGSLDEPNGLGFDAAGDLWVVNEGGDSISEFSPAEITATGSPTPIDTIAGSSTGIDNPYVLAIGPSPAPSVETASVPTGVAGQVYGTALTACGGSAPSCQHYSLSAGTLVDSSANPVPADEQFSFSASGSLPPGITLSSAGYLSGTPTRSGSYEFSVIATDASGSASSPYTYTLTVGAASSITVTPSTLPAATGANPYVAALTACGGVSPGCEHYSSSAGALVLDSGSAVPTSQQYSFSLSGGALPPGLSLSPQGYISGTPTQTGSFTFSVVATDAYGNTSPSESHTLTVGPGISVTTGSFRLAGALPAGAAVVTAGSAGGIAAVSIAGSASPLATVSGSGVSAATDQIGLQIGHNQAGECETALQIGGTGGVVFNAANLNIGGCAAASTSGTGANSQRRDRLAGAASAAGDASAEVSRAVASRVSLAQVQATLAAASDASVTASGTTSSGTVQGGAYTTEFDSTQQSVAFQLTQLPSSAASIPPVTQTTPLSTLISDLAKGSASSGTASTLQQLLSAYGFPSGTTVTAVIPTFDPVATGGTSTGLSMEGGLQSQATALGLSNSASLVNALAEEISDGVFSGPVSDPLGSGTLLPTGSGVLPASAGTSVFSGGIDPFTAAQSTSVPSFNSAGSTIKQTLPKIPLPVASTIVQAPVLAGLITPIGTGAFTETVTAANPTLSSSPLPAQGSVTFTIEVVS